MEITISEVVVTVGWKEAMLSAPKLVTDFASEKSNLGIPTAIGTIKDSIGKWVVITSTPNPTISYRYEAS